MVGRKLGMLLIFAVCTSMLTAGTKGYYRFPAIHGDTIVFTAEGDLWKVDVRGGQARRLTTHLDDETDSVISPDGKYLAFTARYEGASEAYVMPLDGGRPKRLTWVAGMVKVVGWTPAGEVIYRSLHQSTLPSYQLMVVHPESLEQRVLELSQASDGVYDDSGKILFFVRFPHQGSQTKRYKGGRIQSLWRFAEGDAEATPLTSDFPGTSKDPMWWNDRVYFLSDRDGIMNLWSMNPTGGDLRQHTRHDKYDAKTAIQSGGRIVYQCGADIYLYHISQDKTQMVPIELVSDLDQMRERWVEKPMDFLTSASLSPNGDRVALTARGQVFVAPVKQGRLVRAGTEQGVRYRSARFMPDGKSLTALSDETGEVEFWKLDARGISKPEQLTMDGDVLRFDGEPSPDGKWLAFFDKNNMFWLTDIQAKTRTKIAESPGGFGELVWSPDSKWITFTDTASNTFAQIKIFNLENKKIHALTRDRFNSYSPAWSEDGKWLVFLSDRNLRSTTMSPWGPYQPSPNLDKTTKIYMLALQEDLRSPFQAWDELMEEKGDKDDEKKPVEPKAAGKKDKKDKKGKKGKKDGDKKEDKALPAIAIAGIQDRLVEVPVPPGNYGSLTITNTHLFYMSRKGVFGPGSLMSMKLDNQDPKPESIAKGLNGYSLSLDRKKMMLNIGGVIHVAGASGGKLDLSKTAVDLSNWTFSLDPRQEWNQLFVDSWRLMRDYFYDRGMHGVDWKAMREKYEVLLPRVVTRSELSDLYGEMVGELSALHTFVYGGDLRSGLDNDIEPCFLGAILDRDSGAGGYKVRRIYRADPDFPLELSPLAKPGVKVQDGDVILSINGTPLLSVADPGLLLRRQGGNQVLLSVKSAETGKTREVVVYPNNFDAEMELRYDDWEYSRRLLVEEKGAGQMGYVHLRAMGAGNYTEWARDYFPVFNRKGLIIDVRHNRGGNIDSWILSSLIRKTWMYWQGRTGEPAGNMHYAFNGHLVVLVNERTASDGEAFAEGFKRLGLGKVIGTRTWGGEIWLTSSNNLQDAGIATAAEFGVYGPEGEWLIEGHGVEPDMVVENLPHQTYHGKDAQLDAAIAHLQKLIKEDPRDTPPPPPHPDKSHKKQ